MAAAASELVWRDGVALGAAAGNPQAALWTAWEPPGDGSVAASSVPCLKPHRATFCAGSGAGTFP